MIADTSGLLALLDADSPLHSAARNAVLANSEPLVVAVTVLPELPYLVASRLDLLTELAVLRAASSGNSASRSSLTQTFVGSSS